MDTHHFVSVLPGVLEQLNDGSAYHQIRLDACNKLLHIHKIFADHDVFLPRDVADRALDLADEFLPFNNYLLKTALEKGQLMYHMIFKHHLFWHITMMAAFQNPRWSACFEFEDIMGQKKTCAQNAAGSSLRIVGGQVMQH